jgi:hypothetical protein
MRSSMEGAFGADFGRVRTHDGADARDLNERLGARAFTVGHDVFFRDGVPDAGTSEGQHLLAHELTHTIQQHAGGTSSEVGRVSSDAPGRIRRKIGFEFETALPASRRVDGEEQAVMPGPARLELAKQLQADKASVHEGRERVRGHEVLVDRMADEGWMATVDNTSRLGEATRVNLELVTKPPISTGGSETDAVLATTQVISNVQRWVSALMARNPATNRIPLADPNYVIGFPSPAQLGQLELPAKFPQFERDKVRSDAYTQVNLGVGLEHVESIVSDPGPPVEGAAHLSRTMNQPKDANVAGLATGRAVAARVANLLGKSGYRVTDQQNAAFTGFAILLCTAVIGARTSSPKELLKKDTTILPKSNLARWWDRHLQAIEPGKQTPYFDAFGQNLDRIVRAFLSELKVHGIAGSHPLFPLRQEQFAEFDDLKELRYVTVEEYVNGVVNMDDDPLTTVALRHKAATGHGSSEIPAENVAAELGGGAARTAGVLELRKIAGFWKLDRWDVEAINYVLMARHTIER